MSSRVLALVVLGACSYDAPSGVTPGDDATLPDGPLPDTPVSNEAHLVITEICVEGTIEFIEIHNPTAAAVDLTTYYLSDVNEYWRLPGLPGETIPVISSDFLVKFPDGASLGVGQTIVVAIQGDAFATAFGMAPTYTVGVAASGTPMVETVQPDQPTTTTRLTDDGELVVLFEWDGARDLVRDVDIVIHGTPMLESNRLVAKAPIDGPDAGTTPTSYATDARTASMADRGPDDDRFSYKRVAFEGTHEAASGGNGLTGHDETSEALQLTWNTGSMPTTPGTFVLP